MKKKERTIIFTSLQRCVAYYITINEKQEEKRASKTCFLIKSQYLRLLYLSKQTTTAILQIVYARVRFDFVQFLTLPLLLKYFCFSINVETKAQKFIYNIFQMDLTGHDAAQRELARLHSRKRP